MIDRETYQVIFLTSSYWILLAMCVTWAAVFIKEVLSKMSDDTCRIVIWALAISLFLVVTVWISVVPGFRVLSDESNLISVSKSFYLSKQPLNVTMGMQSFEKFQMLASEIPKRPLLYPFFISILHSIFGYHSLNAFLTNTLFLLFFLTVTIVVVVKVRGWMLAIAATFLVLSQPIITLSATSAGLDFFSVFWLFAFLLCLWKFLNTRTEQSFILLWCTGIMLSHTRYESLIYPLIVFLVLAIVYPSLILALIRKYFVLLPMTLVFLIPLILQFYLSQGKYENPVGQPLFSLEYGWRNVVVYFQNFLRLDFYLPYATLLNLLALAVILDLAISFLKGRLIISLNHKSVFYSIIFLLLAVNMLIFMMHFMGSYNHPAQARFFIFSSLIYSFIPIIFSEKVGWLTPKRIVTAAILLFLIYHPVSTSKSFSNSLNEVRKTRFETDFFKTKGRRDILLIIDRPGQYVIDGMSAVDFDFANKNYYRLIMNKGNFVFKEIYTVQEVSYSTAKVLSHHRLDARYQLTDLAKKQLTGDSYIVISRVKNL